MNKVILMGRLTRDPEVRYSAGENALAIASAFSPAEYLTSGSLVKRPIKITLFIVIPLSS